jgi:nitroreductase
VLRTAASKEKLKACAFDQPQITQAPAVLICCGDRTAGKTENIEAVIQLAMQHQAITETYADVMRQQIPAMFAQPSSFETQEAWTNRHTMLAVAHLMIAAASFGVDSCPMEGFVQSKVKTEFAIPDSADVCCILCLGYAIAPLKRFGGRFGLNQVCFSEQYGDSF